MQPPLDDLLATARVVSLPLITRFRGIDRREALLVEGPEGWSEFSPFVEYDDG
jgi:o-succinylbenzoate synthase